MVKQEHDTVSIIIHCTWNQHDVAGDRIQSQDTLREGYESPYHSEYWKGTLSSHWLQCETVANNAENTLILLHNTTQLFATEHNTKLLYL